MSGPRRIALVPAGGTIQLLGRNRLDMASYGERVERLSIDDLLHRVPELDDVAPTVVMPFRPLLSHALEDGDLLDLLRRVHEVAEDHAVTGIVVLQGTNTLEDTAYFLNLTLKTDVPLVLSGAMRPASAVSADGYLNLINAVATAASSEARGKGVLVVLNDLIFAAREVSKTATYRVHSFQSRETGPIGVADADRRIVFYSAPMRPHTVATPFDMGDRRELPRVDIVVSHVSADGVMIDAAARGGARGIVCAGTGAGRPTPAQRDALVRAREAGVAVCMASRTGSGRVIQSPGMRDVGFLAADNLLPWKARTLLSLALTVTAEPEDMQRMFDTY